MKVWYSPRTLVSPVRGCPVINAVMIEEAIMPIKPLAAFINSFFIKCLFLAGLHLCPLGFLLDADPACGLRADILFFAPTAWFRGVGRAYSVRDAPKLWRS